jgi:BirA family biotin operon repressor/biotin-[acetyl-CoA-carboxylase] ligase
MNREALLDDFLKRLDEALHDETVPTDYRSRLYRRDGLFAYRDQEGLFRARLKDVLPDGRLLLTDEAGQDRTYAFKEVQFVI